MSLNLAIRLQGTKLAKKQIPVNFNTPILVPGKLAKLLKTEPESIEKTIKYIKPHRQVPQADASLSIHQKKILAKVKGMLIDSFSSDSLPTTFTDNALITSCAWSPNNKTLIVFWKPQRDILQENQINDLEVLGSQLQSRLHRHLVTNLTKEARKEIKIPKLRLMRDKSTTLEQMQDIFSEIERDLMK